MNPVIIGNAELYHGDCIDILRTLPDNSIEACLTDPPYGLSNHTEADIRACMAAWLAGKPYQHGKAGFMGKDWDSFVPGPEMWKELYRVLKPGAHLLVFAGTRTVDLMSLALRLAGFECRDLVLYTFGSGFPKALDVSAAIDKMKGMEREVVGVYKTPDGRDYTLEKSCQDGYSKTELSMGKDVGIDRRLLTAPASPEAAQWDGWKSALKPAYEPILLFRKPLDGTIAETVLKWGCGGLNVGACRVGYVSEEDKGDPLRFTKSTRSIDRSFGKGGAAGDKGMFDPGRPGLPIDHSQGRYPGNLIVSSDEEVEKCFPVTNPHGKPATNSTMGGIFGNKSATISLNQYQDSGSASRFFQHCDFTIDEIAEMNGIELKRIVYSGKASKRDRDEGCDGIAERKSELNSGGIGRKCSVEKRLANGDQVNAALLRNHHPTCKPSSLLRYLLKLIVPPGATVIDPFFGSGSTGKAALLEGFNVIGIEREAEYFEIAQARCAYVSPEAFTIKPKAESVESTHRQEKLF